MVVRKRGAATAEVDRLKKEAAAAIQGAVTQQGLSTLADCRPDRNSQD
jgi:hypothetical protein